MPDSEFIHFSEETAGENAKAIVRMAVENFKNRKQDLVHIPDIKANATVGYSVEAIKKCLDGVTNTQVDVTGTMKPLIECVKSGDHAGDIHAGAHVQHRGNAHQLAHALEAVAAQLLGLLVQQASCFRASTASRTGSRPSTPSSWTSRSWATG